MFSIILKFNKKIKDLLDNTYKIIRAFIYNFYKTITNLKFISISIVVLFALFFMAFETYQYATQPETCINCHEMKPEYLTWRASAHGNFKCIDCHSEKGLVKNIKTTTTRFYKHLSGDYKQPVEMHTKSSNKICLECHSGNRLVSPSGDLQFPHKNHVNKGFECIECHTGSVHGNILEKGYTTNTDYLQWTKGMGRSYMQEKFTVTSMDKCMTCHKENNVSNECSTCHTGIGIPKDHKEKDWLQKHGPKAKEDIKACDKCHSYTNNWIVFNEVSTSYGEYARNNRFCSKCHVGMEGLAKDFPTNKAKSKNASKRGTKITNYKPVAEKPVSHNDNWRQIHGDIAKNDENGCMVCHDELRNPKANSTTTYCVNCHKRPHKFPEKHPVPLKGVRFNKSCFKCHYSKNCNMCHAIKE